MAEGNAPGGVLIGIGKFRFSGRELFELFVSALVISLVFAYPFSACHGFLDTACILLSTFFVFLIVGSAFVIHESSHKLTAQYYRVWSEYRMWTSGLLLALVMKLVTGFAFIAPGAAYFVPFRRHGPWAIPLTNEQVGKIGWAGPVSNIALAAVFFALLPSLGSLALIGIQINLSLAMFNLIPFNPFDGAKVFAWNRKVWVATAVAVVAMLYLAGI